MKNSVTVTLELCTVHTLGNRVLSASRILAQKSTWRQSIPLTFIEYFAYSFRIIIHMRILNKKYSR